MNMMKCGRLLVAGISFCAWNVIAEDAPKDDVLTIAVPALVKATVQKEAADGKILEISRETENGKIVYSAVISIQDQEYSMEVGADGTLRSKELSRTPSQAQVALDQAPEAVKATFLREAQGFQLTEVTKNDAKLTFTAEVGINGHKYWVVVDGEGRLVSKNMQD